MMRNMPPITKNLLVINILMFLGTIVSSNAGIDLNNILGLHFFMSESFHVYQLITYMFMHASAQHIFFNMLALWMFGRIMEQAWGPKRYLIFYMVCGIGAGICQEAVQYIQYMSEGLNNYSYISDGFNRIPMSQYIDLWTTVGASGAVYGILLGFGLTFPNATIMLLIPPIPLKAKWLVIGYAAIELFSGLSSSGSNVAHFAHLGGMLFGLGLILYWRHKTGVGRGGFSSWQEYKPQHSAWQKFKSRSAGNKQSDTNFTYEQTEQPSATTDSMAERLARQAEVDRILNKVKKSGYGCLSEEEKKTLFDFRNN